MEYFWIISFWFICTIFILPVPFRIYMYASGKVTLPKSVIIDESFATLVGLLGCVGMYGYVYKIPIYNQLVWQLFFVVYIVYSIAIIFISPKLKMISDLAGRRKQQILIVAVLLITLPLPVALYFYGFGDLPW